MLAFCAEVVAGWPVVVVVVWAPPVASAAWFPNGSPARRVGWMVVTKGVGSTPKGPPRWPRMYSVAMRELVSSMVVKMVSEFIVKGIVCVVVVK